MAYITPDTDIYFLEGVPLDNTYTNTLYFSTKANQTTYFQSKKKIALDGYSYQRATSNELKVGVATAKLYTCNYMMFRNTAYSDKWFYAFILNVEYVNDNTTLVTYEVDEIQTWFFDFTVKGWVSREHTATDNIGEHILPEPVDIGEYTFPIYHGILGTGSGSTDQTYCVALYVDNDGTNASYLKPFVTGCKMRIFDIRTTDGMSALNSLIDAYISSPDSIVAMYLIPHACLPQSTHFDNGYFDVTNVEPFYQLDASFDKATKSMSFDGYTPKNAKLYTYPYNFFHMDNGNGESLKLRYEFFKNLTPTVLIEGETMQPATIVCRPTNYKGVEETTDTESFKTLNTESLTISNYPQVSWNTDTFKAWVAQNAVPTVGKLATDIIATAINPAAGGSSFFGTVANTLSEGYSASIAADVCRGSNNNGNVNFAVGKMGFFQGRCCITGNYAKTIDKFFDRFGYNVSRTGSPLTHSRPHWNYVQMVNCDLVGSVPANAASVIVNAHNAGITYWKNPSEVGNYALDNSI